MIFEGGALKITSKGYSKYCSADSLLGGNLSVLVIKLDHEVGLRRYWYQFQAEFRAGSFYDGPKAWNKPFEKKLKVWTR